jgi:hypothetical protein
MRVSESSNSDGEGQPVPRIGITGHTRLSSATTTMVYTALCDELRRYRPATLHGITCLARGADQLFARAVLAAGGTIEAILPATDYRNEVVGADNRPEFDALVARAARVTYMPFGRSDRVAYMAASEELLRRSDLLFAVWDGSMNGNLGETGEVVVAARCHNMSVRVLWPANAVRG